jgi:protein-S-isoprenylcysteine O-methyltransferase Ste14
MIKPRSSAAIQTAGFLVLAAIMLFGAAGRLDVPIFWLYIVALAGTSIASLFLIDEDLVQERMRPGGYPLGMRLYFVFLLCMAHWILAGLDRRFHWSNTVPMSLRIAALVVFATGLAFFVWAMHVNRFFSSVVRIQRERGHHLVSSGPYHWVRHPGYAGAIAAIVASGIALCSWLATAVGALGVALVLWRVIVEDRTLQAELPGYPEYALRVRWRLIPGIW